MQNAGAWEDEIASAQVELREVEAATERQVRLLATASYVFELHARASRAGCAARAEASRAHAQARWRRGGIRRRR